MHAKIDATFLFGDLIMKKLLFIFNPKSGKGQLAPDLMEVLNIFASGGYELTVHPTQRALDAYETIKDRACEYDLLVLSGGDGTLNECVRAMMSLDPLQRPIIGYIPSGTVNDFATSRHISKKATEAARDIIFGERFSCDIGGFQDSYFSYVAAFGAFTDVAYGTPQNLKNLYGNMAYLIEGAKKLTSLKSYHLTVETDQDSTTGDFILGLVTNTTSVGGFHLKTADVSLTDGLCEVILIRASSGVKNLSHLLSSIVLQDFSSEHLFYAKSKNIKITFDTPTPWTLDGEYGGEHQTVNICMHQRALTFMVPEDMEKKNKPQGPKKQENDLDIRLLPEYNRGT